MYIRVTKEQCKYNVMQSTCILQIGTDTKYHTKKCISGVTKEQC